MTRWYRAYEGTVTDEKLAEVSIIAGCSRSVVIASWHAILENAASVNDAGKIETGPRRVAAALCEPVKILEAVFAGLEEVGMLSDCCVIAWQRRQFESDSSTERSRRHRQQKQNADATLHDATAAPQKRPPLYMSSVSVSAEEGGSESKNRSHTREKEIKEDFGTWYELYPRHQGRGSAERAYRSALKKADKSVLLEAVKWFSLQRKGEDPKFTPLPATWLNSERWLDERTRTIVSENFDQTDLRGWADRLRVWRDKAMWIPKWGPRPDEPGCKCPAEILNADIAA